MSEQIIQQETFMKRVSELIKAGVLIDCFGYVYGDNRISHHDIWKYSDDEFIYELIKIQLWKEKKKRKSITDLMEVIGKIAEKTKLE